MSLATVFAIVLQMSWTASYVILAVLLLRLALRRAPKMFSYALWFLVLFRLLCPVSFGSSLSILPQPHLAGSQFSLSEQGNPALESNLPMFEKAVSQKVSTGTPGNNRQSAQGWLGVTAAIWFAGLAGMLLYGLISYLRLQRRLRQATLLAGRVWESDRVASPFVLGLGRPRIYLPLGLDAAAQELIVAHEQTHVRHGDPYVKLFAFGGLALHWFNPLVWVSFVLLNKDMELACDESVLARATADIRSSYAQTLLSLAVKPRGILTAVAFGENHVKARIQNVLHYQKTRHWLLLAGVVVILAAVVVLATNPPAAVRGHSDMTMSQRTVRDQLAEDWAKALQTRDGKVRYDMMNDVARQEFIAAQKQLIGSEEWHYVIGGSSPKPQSWETSWNGDMAIILYTETDSGGDVYFQKESVTFGLADGRPVVTAFRDYGIENNDSYLAFTAEDAAKSYISGLLAGDFQQIAASTIGEAYTWAGQELWDTIRITNINILQQETGEQKACYKLELTVAEPGDSDFVQGENYRWLLLEKVESGGWAVAGLLATPPTPGA